MGRSYARAVEKEMELSYDPVLVNRVRGTGARLAEVADRKEVSFYFNVIKSDEYNAFALPGGYIYIYDSLVQALKTDDQLAFVLAHEIAHVVARHNIKRLQAIWGANLLVLGSSQIDSSGNMSAMAGIMTVINTLLSGYSQEDELAADSLAVKYTEAAGFKPDAGIEVMAVLDEKDRDKPRQVTYFRTHPFSPQRIRRIKEKAGLPLNFSDVINS